MKSNVLFSVTISLILLWSSTGIAQQLISTAGGYYTGSNISLSWSLGEPVVETFSNNNVVLTQGFQQPFLLSSQSINIPAGWSGISSYVNPSSKAVTGMFSDIEPQMVILQSMTGVYWPSEGTNTIGNWNYKEGYKIKMTTPANLEVSGLMPVSKTITLSDNWSLMPVLSPCVIGTDVFSQVSGQLVIAKDVAGNGVFWPAYGINTMQTLSPGKAYFVKMEGSAPLTFPGCDLKNNLQSCIYQPASINPWNEPEHTPASHVIAVPVSGFIVGDIIGAFSSTGICCGLVEINRKDGFEALTVFGDDAETSNQARLTEGEPLSFRLFRTSTQAEYILDVVYNQSLPNRDVFADGGLSAIETVTLSVPGLNRQLEPLVYVWPNPNHGSFNLKINNVTDEVTISFMTSQGLVMLTEILQPENRVVSRSFEFLNFPKGMYLLKIQTNGTVRVERVILN